MESKACTKCGLVKPLIEYSYRNKAKNIRTERCKTCTDKYAAKYRAKYRKTINKKQNERFKKPSIKRKKQKYDKKNLPRTRERDRLRYLTDKNYSLKKKLRSRTARVLDGKKKSRKTLSYTCLSLEQLQKWFEFQFDEHMTWENQGSYWHIEHLMPCASFDFTKEEDIEKCFHWTNLGPCEGKENMSKGNKILPDKIEAHLNLAMEFFRTIIRPDGDDSYYSYVCGDSDDESDCSEDDSVYDAEYDSDYDLEDDSEYDLEDDSEDDSEYKYEPKDDPDDDRDIIEI